MAETQVGFRKKRSGIDNIYSKDGGGKGNKQKERKIVRFFRRLKGCIR